MNKNNQCVLILSSLIEAARRDIRDHPDRWLTVDTTLTLAQLNEAEEWLRSRFDYDALSVECAAMEAGE